MNEISTLFNVFLKHKERVAILLTLQKLTLSDPTRTKQINISTNNENFIKNLSHETGLVGKCLKFIQTPPVLASHKSLLKDLQVFTHYKRLQYIFAGKRHS